MPVCCVNFWCFNRNYHSVKGHTGLRKICDVLYPKGVYDPSRRAMVKEGIVHLATFTFDICYELKGAGMVRYVYGEIFTLTRLP